MNKVYIPPIKIQGIKTKLIPYIKQNVIADNDTIWIEPFMGSGVVGFNIAGKKAIFADTNPFIIDFYNQIKEKKINSYIIRDFLQEEGRKLKQEGENYYYKIRERFNRTKSPLDFLFLNRSDFNGMIRFNRKNEFNVPYGHKSERFSKAYITKIVNQVKYVESKILNNEWIFVCQSFEKTLLNISDNSFIYCDPPYLGRHTDYYDTWNEENELKLKNMLYSLNCCFMLSTWECNKYRQNKNISEIWGFCNKISVDHFYHIGGKEINRNKITEALLINYETNKQNNNIIEDNSKLFLDLQYV